MSHMGMADMPVSTMPRGWAAGLLAVTFAMWTVPLSMQRGTIRSNGIHRASRPTVLTGTPTNWPACVSVPSRAIRNAVTVCPTLASA